MAHYAFIDTNYVVVEVIVGKDESNFDWERYYGDLRGLLCKRTSFNMSGGVHTLGGTPLRKNFASIGFTYDPDRDAFIPPKPFPSWLLNEETCVWDPPVSYPNDGKVYLWDEEALSWREYSEDPPAEPKVPPPQPFTSWTYDAANNVWSPPVPYPDESVRHYWDEPSLSWKIYVPGSQ